MLNGRPRGYAAARRRWRQNGSINAFTLSHKSGADSVATVNVHPQPGSRCCMYKMKATVCERDIHGRDETSKQRRFTVKALFEGSVYWLLNIDILLSGLRKEERLSSAYPPPLRSLFPSCTLACTHSRAFIRRAYNTYLRA